MKLLMWTMIPRFLPSFIEMDKTEVTEVVCVCYSSKGLVFGPFLRGRWSDLAKDCLWSVFPHPHPSAKFRPNPSSFHGDTRGNVFQYRYSIGVIIPV